MSWSFTLSNNLAATIRRLLFQFGRGKVLRTSKVGSIYFIEFRLGKYAALSTQSNPNEPSGAGNLGTAVRNFTSMIQKLIPELPGSVHPPRYSATAGLVPEGLFSDADTSAAFEQMTSFLAGTVSFASHVFWHVSEIRELGSRSALMADHMGRFRLYFNRTYEVILTHFQPEFNAAAFGIAPAGLEVFTDTLMVEVIGDKTILIASRYDAVPIRLRITATTARETILSILPSRDTKGPRTDLHLLVGPGRGKRLLGASLAALIVVLATIPGLMKDSATLGQKIVFPILAGLLTIALGYIALPLRN